MFLAADVVNTFYGKNDSGKQTFTIVRVVVDYILFLIAALVLCYCIVKVFYYYSFFIKLFLFFFLISDVSKMSL